MLTLSTTAIAIYRPPDVRPILQAYAGKDIPIEYGKKEAEMKARHVAEWQAKHKGKSTGGISFGSFFGLSDNVRVSIASFPSSFADASLVISSKERTSSDIPGTETCRGSETVPGGAQVHRGQP